MPLTEIENQFFEHLYVEKRSPIDEKYRDELMGIDGSDINRHQPLFETVKRYAREVIEARISAYIEAYKKLGKYPGEEDFEDIVFELKGIAHKFNELFARQYARPFSPPVNKEFLDAILDQLSRHLEEIVGLSAPPLRRFVSEGQVLESNRSVESTETSPRLLVISLHGIRTRGEWQKELTEELGQADIIHAPLDYGFFRAIRILIPSQRKRQVKWLIDEYTRICDRHHNSKPSIIAHSFGTYLVGDAMLRSPEVKFDQIILAGSILPVGYRWSARFAASQFSRVLNEVARQDLIVKIAEWFIKDAGPSGAKEFSDTADRSVIQRKHSRHGHSDLFYILNYRTNWIPFLKGNQPDEQQPEHQDSQTGSSIS